MMPTTYQDFVLCFNHAGQRVSWWFHSDAPVTWPEARDRLVAAGLIRAEDAGGYRGSRWMLSIARETIELHQCGSTPARVLP